MGVVGLLASFHMLCGVHNIPSVVVVWYYPSRGPRVAFLGPIPVLPLSMRVLHIALSFRPRMNHHPLSRCTCRLCRILHVPLLCPHTAYGMMPGAPPPPTTINMPPTYHIPQQQTGGGKQNYSDSNRGGQWRRSNNYQGSRNGGGERGDRRNVTNTQRAYSNATKQHMNLLYCFSCGYDVDHD